jgi:hypothetical protein
MKPDMKLNRKTNIGAICVVLTLASTQASALTLGHVRGGALLGQALDVSVVVQFAADEDVASTCFAADVSYGEAPLERSRVTVKAQPGPQPNTQLVRITASALVDEATVTVNLVAACGPKASRRYVLLSDLQKEASFAPVLASSETVAASVPSSRGDGLAAQPTATAAETSRKPKDAKKSQAPVKSASAVTAMKPAASNGKAEREAAIQAAKLVNTAALEELQQRIAAIEQWQAGSSAAEELLKSGTHAKALETDIKQLQMVGSKNQKSIQDIAAALESAESQNYGRLLVYALGAMLAACLAALAYVFARIKRAGSEAMPWWSGDAAPAQAQRHPGSPVAPVLPAAVMQTDQQAVATVAPSATKEAQAAQAPLVPLPEPEDVDIDLSHTGAMDLTPTTMPVPVAAVNGISSRAEDVQLSQGNLKAINTNEMLDVRQQAEFFMALGQHDEAVRLLESNITDSADVNPLVFLDLLKILHTLSRRADFERYREEFNHQFTGRIPEYSSFLMEGNGLEAYDDICQQIIVLWPTEYTIDFIEQCLVRVPEDDPEQGIDLEAFKDLLLLYGVLKRLDQTVDSAVKPFSASRTANNTQLGMQNAAAVTALDVDRDTVPPLPVAPEASGRVPQSDLDLDLDLDLDMDVVDAPVAAADNGNLINFDMSGYELPQSGKPPKQ